MQGKVGSMSDLLGVTNQFLAWKMPLEGQVERIAQMGFRYLELMTPLGGTFPRDMDQKRRNEVSRLCKSFGLKLYSISPSYADLNLTSVNPGIRKETIRQIQENIDLARDLEANFVLVIPGKRYLFYTTPFEVAWRFSIEGLKECARHAENLSVTCLIEQAPFMFAERASDIGRLVQEVNSPNLLAMTDTGNACVREAPQQAIEILDDLLCHLHLTDGDGKTYAHLPIGTGTIDFKAVKQSLDKVGFRGISVIEVWHPPDLEGGILQSKQNLEKLGWKTIEEEGSVEGSRPSSHIHI